MFIVPKGFTKVQCLSFSFSLVFKPAINYLKGKSEPWMKKMTTIPGTEFSKDLYESMDNYEIMHYNKLFVINTQTLKYERNKHSESL